MTVGVGYKVSEANLILAAQFRTAGYAAYQGPSGGYFIQLHTAEPGPNGTTAVANSGRRVALGAMAVPSAGQTSNLADITFAAVTSTQPYTHYSAWDASGAGAGNFKFDGPLTGTGTVGQDFVIAAGDLVAQLNTDT